MRSGERANWSSFEALNCPNKESAKAKDRIVGGLCWCSWWYCLTDVSWIKSIDWMWDPERIFFWTEEQGLFRVIAYLFFLYSHAEHVPRSRNVWVCPPACNCMSLRSSQGSSSIPLSWLDMLQSLQHLLFCIKCCKVAVFSDLELAWGLKQRVWMFLSLMSIPLLSVVFGGWNW